MARKPGITAFLGLISSLKMQPHPPCTINYFCIGAVLLFAGSILLVTLGFTVVLPQQKTRRWPQVKCTVRSSVLHRNLCSCDKQFTRKGVECFGKFPCLEIFVTYQRIYKANDSTDDVTVSVPANSLPIVFNTSLNVSCHLHDNSTLPDLKLGETNTTTGDRTAGTTLHTVNGHTISSSSSQTDGVTSGVRSVTSSGMSISQSPPTTKTPVEAVRDNLPDTAGVLFKSWSDAFYNQVLFAAFSLWEKFSRCTCRDILHDLFCY